MTSSPQTLKIESLLDQRRLGQAIEELRPIVKRNTGYELADRLETIEDDYGRLLLYYADGTDDPQRDLIFDQLLARAYQLTDAAFANGEGLRPFSEDEFCHVIEQIKAPNAGNVEREKNLQRLFNQILERPISAKTLQSLFDGAEEWEEEKAIALSALMLRLLRTPNDQNLSLLMQQCVKEDEPRLQARAITAIAAILITYARRLPIWKDFVNSLNATLDSHPQLVSKLKKATTLFYLSSETALISQHIQTDIIPKIQKISKKLNIKDLESLTDISDEEDENSFLHKDKRNFKIPSNLSEEMSRIERLSERGSDINFITFVNLKSFDFFESPLAWFRPYRSNAWRKTNDAIGNETDSIASIPGLCDSDRYSLALAFDTLPPEEQSSVLSAIPHDNISASETQELGMKGFAQDLYRFFILYKQRSLFRSPFAEIRSLNKTSIFDVLRFSNRDVYALAKDAFSRRLYSLCDTLLTTLMVKIKTNDPTSRTTDDNPTELDMYRILGLSAFALKQYDSACKYLEPVYQNDPDDDAIATKLARACYYVQDDDLAADIYLTLIDRLSSTDTLRYARCLHRQKRDQEALELLFRLEISDGYDSTPILHQYIASISALLGKEEQASRYALTSGTAKSLLIASLIELKNGNKKKAAEYLLTAQSKGAYDAEELERELNATLEYVPSASSALQSDLRFLIDHVILSRSAGE